MPQPVYRVYTPVAG